MIRGKREKGGKEERGEVEVENIAEERRQEGQRVHFQDLEAQEVPKLKEVKLSLKDINPIMPILAVLRRLNNLVILFGSGNVILTSAQGYRINDVIIRTYICL